MVPKENEVAMEDWVLKNIMKCSWHMGFYWSLQICVFSDNLPITQKFDIDNQCVCQNKFEKKNYLAVINKKK
jgi:hypothetical protein